MEKRRTFALYCRFAGPRISVHFHVLIRLRDNELLFFSLLSSRITFLIIIIKSPCFFFLLYATEYERKKEEKRHTHYCRNAFRLAAEAAEHLRKKKKEYLYDRSKETNQRGLDDAVRF